VIKLPSLRELSAAVVVALARHGTVPLLVLRLPELEQIAWQRGVRAARRLERDVTTAFAHAARCIVRAEDTIAHDVRSDVFVIALLDAARERRLLGPADCRIAVERVSLQIAQRVGRRMETGWWAIDRATHARGGIPRAVALALERGARERERYEFLAALGHELRTPLASIRGYIESLLDGGGDASSTRRYLETARREALRMGRMVEGMLEFSLLDLSPPALARRTCDASVQIAAAVDALAPLALAKRIAVVRPHLEREIVRIDADACMHALLNLIDNAITHGREMGRVVVSSTRVNAAVEIAIDDDGTGRFASSARGHGVGLTIARTIAERAGGGIRLERSHLGGTRAVLCLLAASDLCEAETAASAS
jgi:signal transduction histidine kinase